MNHFELAVKITDRVSNQTDDQVTTLYKLTRTRIMARRFAGHRADQAEARVMAILGNILESRIGEDAFDQIMNECDFLGSEVA